MDAAMLDRIGGIDPSTCDRAAAEQALADVARVQAWLVGCRARFARRLGELAASGGALFVEQVVAEVSKVPQRRADRIVQDASALAELPEFEQALAGGAVSEAHVEVMARAMAHLEPPQRGELVARAGRLLAVTAAAPPEQFERAVRREVRSLERDDGAERFARQRRATELRHWIDRDSGMVCLHGRFDPERGLGIVNRLDAVARALAVAADWPVDSPTDPDRRADHLRALAFLELIGPGSSLPVAGRAVLPEALLVIDERTLRTGYHRDTVLDLGADVDLPLAAVRRMVMASQVVPVVMRDGVVVRMLDGGRLDLGRERHLANRAQRRALRAMYPTCAVPDCGVRFSHTQIHHAVWWDHGGMTDLRNLLPLCSRHHHAVHDRGWRLCLDPVTRWLRVERPDGTVMDTGPPYARAA